MTLLESREVSLQKGHHSILKLISFSLNSGEILALTGRSGSGKTSLLRLLCRMEDPSSGDLFFEGTNLVSQDPLEVRRQIQWVFQTPVMVEKTVLEDLQLGRSFSKDKDATSAENAEAWMEKLHLAPALLKEDPKRLSVGEAQRIALARAILLQPKVLLLDEPTSALDQVSKEAIEETLRNCARQGISILLVTHDPRQMSELASRGLELSKGEIVRRW